VSVLICGLVYVVVEWPEAEMLNFRTVLSELSENLIRNFGVKQSTLIRRIVINQ
jgi:hypothetical protein